MKERKKRVWVRRFETNSVKGPWSTFVMVSQLLHQSKSKLVWETITSPRANKLRVQWTTKLTSRQGWKTNKKLLKSCQKSKYQYDNCRDSCQLFWTADSFASSRRSILGGAARNMAQKKQGREARRGRRQNSCKASPLFRSAVFSLCDPTTERLEDTITHRKVAFLIIDYIHKYK